MFKSFIVIIESFIIPPSSDILILLKNYHTKQLDKNFVRCFYLWEVNYENQNLRGELWKSEFRRSSILFCYSL